MSDATLNGKQRALLAERRAVYRRRGILSWIEAGGLLLLGCIAAKAIHVDWLLLTVLHETYADSHYASSAYAWSGLFVVFSLHAISTVLRSRALDRALAVVAALGAIVFIAGTCAMLGAISLDSGLSSLGQSLPSIDNFFSAAQNFVEENFGDSAFQKFFMDFSVPLFAAAICTAFLLTTFLIKCIVDLLLRRIPRVVQTVLEAGQSAALYRGIDSALARESRAIAGLESAHAKRAHWQPSRIADLIVGVTEEVLRPFDALVTGRLLSGRTTPEALPLPHEDGGPPLDLAELQGRLAEIREATEHGRLLRALEEA